MKPELERPDSPRSLDELLARARGLAGWTITMLGKRVGHRVPKTLRWNKGFVGMCVELALGAKSKSAPEPDFPHLGVELKTIPVRPDGRPTESTHVCAATLDGSDGPTFRDTLVYRKLARVLFVPVEDVEGTPLGARRLGMPFLWTMGAEDEAVIERDWRDIAGRIRAGEVDEVSGREGVALQLRTKAQTALDTTLAMGDEGWLVAMRPRAWYLRASFTGVLVRRAFGLDPAPEPGGDRG